MGQELQIPDSFKNRQMASAFVNAGLNAQDDNLAAGIGQSYAVIGYKGKTWSLRYRGERKNFVTPDGSGLSSYLDVIILAQAEQKSKSYYKKFDPGTSDGDRPICSSIDGSVPDADVVEKQCTSCAICPRNVWKTDPNTGRKGRECTDYKRLAVLILPTQTKPILGTPLLEPAFLRVPPDSLNSLAIMGETMGSQGMHYSSYITRISFDPQKAHPCMVFRPHNPLSDAEAPVVLEIRADPAVGRIIGTKDANQIGHHAVETALSLAPVNSGLTAGAGNPNPTPQSSAPGGGIRVEPSGVLVGALPAIGSAIGAGSAPPHTPSELSTQETHPASNGLLDTGFGGASTASAGPNQLATSGTVADAGEPEDSDADMDARIASLIAKV